MHFVLLLFKNEYSKTSSTISLIYCLYVYIYYLCYGSKVLDGNDERTMIDSMRSIYTFLSSIKEVDNSHRISQRHSDDDLVVVFFCCNCCC